MFEWFVGRGVRCKKWTKKEWKADKCLKKTLRTIAQKDFENARKSDSLQAKYKAMRGGLRLFYIIAVNIIIVMFVNYKFRQVCVVCGQIETLLLQYQFLPCGCST